MPKYIDVENYCENICRCSKEHCDKAKCPIHNAPAEDVAPVRHGKWENYRAVIDIGDKTANFEIKDIIKCSLCGEGYLKSKRPHIYCPNCGAIMTE